MRLLLRRKCLKRTMLTCMLLIIPYMLNRKLNGNQTSKGPSLEDTIGHTLITNHTLRTHHAHPSVLVSLPGNKRNNSHLSRLEAVNVYCKSPFTETHGNEGQAPYGFRLRMVHMFIRHGDRTSIQRLHGYVPEVFSCKFSTWYTGNNEKFKLFPQHMNRMTGKQQKRNHFLNWALYPDRNVCGFAILTSRGALQLLQLGIHLQNSYSSHEHLFDSKLSLSNQLLAKSTSTSRTYQSAIAFLYAFLPVFNISRINIEDTSDLQFCTKKYSLQKNCYCKNGKELILHSNMNQYLNTNTSDYKNVHQTILELFKVESLSSLSSNLDEVIPSFCQKVTAPCSFPDFSHSNFSSCSEILRKIWDTIWYTRIVKESPNLDDTATDYLKYCSIVITPVLVEVIHRIKDLVENRPTRRFILYSGHDLTLFPLLVVLGLHDGRWPPYASRIVMEIYERESGTPTSKFYLKYLYNGIDKTRQVIFCKGKTYMGLCSFDLFSEFVLAKLLRRFGFSSYYDACNRRNKPV